MARVKNTFCYLRGILTIIVLVQDNPLCSAMSVNEQSFLDEFIQNVMRCRKLPGLTVSVVKDDRLIYARTFGFKEFYQNSRVSNATKFCIGSLSKGFTATLLAAVIGRNMSLTWDTTLREILGEEFLLSDEHRTRFATIRDILAHKTGVPSYFGALMAGSQQSVADIVRGLRFMPALKKFHSKYTYNNYMFILAGYVLEKLTGKPLQSLMQELLFGPLSMTSATFAYKINQLDNFALPHMSFDGRLKPLDIKWLQESSAITAAGGICADGVDMAKWMRFHLRGGRHPDGRHLVDTDTFSELHIPQMPTPMPLGKKLLKPPEFPIHAGRFAYNLGWGSGTYRGYHNLLHGGRVFGFDSNLWLYPDQDIGIFTSANGPMNDDSMNGLKVIHYMLSDILLGEQPWLNHSTACTFPDPWMQNSKTVKLTITAHSEGETNDINPPYSKRRISRRDKIPPKPFVPPHFPLWEYAGKYGHYAFGVITVVLNNTDDLLHLWHGKFGHAVLYPSLKRHTFSMKFLGVLEYATRADGWDHLLPLVFGVGRGSRIQKLFAVFIEPEASPVFERDLDWREVPDPHFARRLQPCFLPQTSAQGKVLPPSMFSWIIVLLTVANNFQRLLHKTSY